MTRNYFHNCQGCVIVFDLTDQQSLDSVTDYIRVFKEECPADALDNIVLVGTKLDDVANRKVAKEDAEKIAIAQGCQSYFETSSSTGENVDEAFYSVTARAY